MHTQSPASVPGRDAAPSPAAAAAPAPERGAARIPSLDGLRALSIIAVLLGHLSGTRGFPVGLGALIHNGRVDIANLGVRVFFVISGFLITGLLMEEEARHGRVSLSRFYLRRTFRIFPAYLVFLLVTVGAAAAGAIALNPGDVGHALTYTMNYHGGRSWYVGHLWSLSVEEQFYLLWPLMFVVLGVSRAMTAALAFVLAAPLIRMGVWHLAPDARDLIGNTFGTTGDAIAIGCLLAGWRARLWGASLFRRVVTSAWMVPALVVLGVAISTRSRPALLLGVTLTNVGIALAIERCVRRPAGRVGRVLNAAPVVYVGTLSYSIYLWQQLFINRQSAALVSSFPINCLLAAACALLCYYLVERPMLRARVAVERSYLPRGATASHKPALATPREAAVAVE